MALETLKGVEEIGGYEVNHYSSKEQLGLISRFIDIDHEHNTISFKIQNGPIKENGVNGCQVDTLIHAAKTILEGLDKNYPCLENGMAINKLQAALAWLNERTRNRQERGVEGTSHE